MARRPFRQKDPERHLNAVRLGLFAFRTHKWLSSWDNDEQKTVWTCARCGRTRVRIGEMDPRKSGFGD